MIGEPSPNGANGDGRDSRGRFAVGNPGGPGNPNAAKIGKLRAALFDAFTLGDMAKNIATVRAIRDDTKAKPADRLTAAKLLHDWAVGPTADLEERIQRVEQAVMK